MLAIACRCASGSLFSSDPKEIEEIARAID